MIIQDKSRKCLKEEQEIFSIALQFESYSDNKFWTAYFSTQKKKDRNLQLRALNTLEQLSQMKAPKPEILYRNENTSAALAKLKLKPIWRVNNKSFGSKVKMMRSLVIPIFLFVCESWTIPEE